VGCYTEPNGVLRMVMSQEPQHIPGMRLSNLD